LSTFCLRDHTVCAAAYLPEVSGFTYEELLKHDPPRGIRQVGEQTESLNLDIFLAQRRSAFANVSARQKASKTVPTFPTADIVIFCLHFGRFPHYLGISAQYFGSVPKVVGEASLII
jgi:hypothetical protein